MSKHPETARFRNLAQESEDGWAISYLCDLADDQHAQTEAALIEMADASKPRVVTTVEELDALPDEAVVRSDFGVIHEKRVEFDTGRVVWVCPGDSDENAAGKIMLPAAVLHEPTTDPTR